jgi:hypothetical protein
MNHIAPRIVGVSQILSLFAQYFIVAAAESLYIPVEIRGLLHKHSAFSFRSPGRGKMDLALGRQVRRSLFV